MTKYCVVTADGGRARFFIKFPAWQASVEPRPDLVEEGEDLINAEARLTGHELWSDTPAGGMAHTYDDHRDQHSEEFKHRFAKRIAQHALQLAQRHHAQVLIIAAEKHMLGLLRKELDASAGALEIREVSKDLSRLGPAELQRHLAEAGVLPPARDRSRV
jgi:protein required for attachment to host cells